MEDILLTIRQELEANADEKTKQSGQRYFKEEVHLIGVKSAVVEKIGRDFFKLFAGKTKTEVFRLCEELLNTGYMEESFIACHWSYYVRKEFQPGDLAVFEKWIDRYVSNWSTCDTLCNHTVGHFIEQYPEYISELKNWAKSETRWKKRASAVSLIIPARHGKFLEDIFEIAGILLTDPDDLVQKGYGWMLKAASQAHQQDVFDYIFRNRKNMPRTALRYAIEKMPDELRRKGWKSRSYRK